MTDTLLWTTKAGWEIFVKKGGKSPQDFVVRYRQPGKRLRTPKHIHIAVDLYAKRTGNPGLVREFCAHLVRRFQQIAPLDAYPPRIRLDADDVRRFEPLGQWGEYDAEFLLAVNELLILQEKTNYPQGTATLAWAKFPDADVFTIVSSWSWNNR